MHIIGYIQTDNVEDITDVVKCFASTIPSGSIVEVTIYNKNKASPDGHIAVYIDEQLVYDLDFNKKSYKKQGKDGKFGEFYLTDTEAFALFMYLNNFGTQVVPHWWPYAARNIARHSNPLKELMEAQKENKKIVVMR